MSLNEIVDPNYKPWLNPVVNSIKIDGDWTYKESDKTAGDSLVLNSNLIAKWSTVPLDSPYGNGIAARPAAQNITNISAPLILNYLAPSSPLYSFNSGNNHITIIQPGIYIAFANITYHNNVNSTILLELSKQEDINPLNFAPVPGSIVRSFPGTTVFSVTDPNYQYTTLCTSGIFKTVADNRQLRVVCSSSGSGVALDSQYCSLVILRITSL